MTDADRIADLLLEWEDRREHGTDVPAEELCRNCPHLLSELARRIHALKVTSWMSAGDGDPPPSPTPPTTPPPLPLGGRYRLDVKVGEGGFAEVWKGYDLELRRAVAVKRPKPTRSGTTDRLERFVAEARRVAGLKHPGVVPVFDVGRDGDAAFIVSELVEGGSLADRIARARPTTRDAVRLVAEVAETLAYAHRHGFLHRDIKPANVLIDHHGRALVADFGIARSPGDGADGGGVSFGTLVYMAPEHVEGRPVDHRSDIYGLGVVLYELLAGRLPHDGSDPAGVRRKIVAGPVPPLAGVPKGLEKICRKCLARNPTDRYQDAGELAAALRRVAAPSSSSRRRLVAVVGVMLISAVLVAVVVADRHQRPAVTGAPVDDVIDPLPAPTSLEAALALGKRHFDKQEWAEAEAAFTAAVRLSPESAEAYHRRAGSVFNTGRAKDSLPDFDAAARLDPKNPEIFKNRGIAYLNLLRFDEALADLTHALEIDPDHPEPYRKVLGQTYARRAYEHVRAERPAEAMGDMNEAIRCDPTTADYFDKRGGLHYNRRHYEEALTDFSEAVRRDPRQPTHYLHRGYAYHALGRSREAADDFKKARPETPTPGKE